MNRCWSHIRRHGMLAPNTLIFGNHAFEKLKQTELFNIILPPVAIITGGSSQQKTGTLEKLSLMLKRAGLAFYIPESFPGEPTAGHVDRITNECRANSIQSVIGLGGGSAIDTAKAVAALLTNPGAVEDYLEGVGTGAALSNHPAPFLAIPTVSGTGAEMTRNAVIASHTRHYKKSMRDTRMIPDIALVDPVLTRTVPQSVTAAGGLDAITQLIESIISAKRQPAVTALACEGLRGAHTTLTAIANTPDDLQGRAQAAFSSTISGVCLTNAGLAMAHGIAAALGAHHDIAHGLACGILLPHTLRYNRDACKPELAGAFRAMLQTHGQCDEEIIDRGIAELDRLLDSLDIPTDLKCFELAPDQLETLAQSAGGSSMSGNPIPMNPDNTLEFLKRIA